MIVSSTVQFTRKVMRSAKHSGRAASLQYRPHRSNIGIVAPNPTFGMHVYFCVVR
jgi:hypothetical protein